MKWILLGIFNILLCGLFIWEFFYHEPEIKKFHNEMQEKFLSYMEEAISIQDNCSNIRNYIDEFKANKFRRKIILIDKFLSNSTKNNNYPSIKGKDGNFYRFDSYFYSEINIPILDAFHRNYKFKKILAYNPDELGTVIIKQETEVDTGFRYRHKYSNNNGMPALIRRLIVSLVDVKNKTCLGSFFIDGSLPPEKISSGPSGNFHPDAVKGNPPEFDISQWIVDYSQ